MSADSAYPIGAYSRILDEDIASFLNEHPELKALLRKMDDEEQPQQYTLLLARILHSFFYQANSDDRIALLNRIIDLLGATDGHDYLLRKKILDGRQMVTSIHPALPIEKPWPLPQTSLNTSYLFTGAAGAPSLDNELRQEMRSADRIDILVSFIKYSGLRLLLSALEEATARKIPVRVMTTSYMGASDPDAIAWLVRQPNITLKISYDTEHTRLHAKAYHFYRETGYSTAYIGSANLSRAAITSGLEWTVKITQQDQPHVLQQFRGEFETYWESEAFEVCHEAGLDRFRKAIQFARTGQQHTGVRFIPDIAPRSFQERILEKLQAERMVHTSFRNLVVAATGTGKTVISAFDYLNQCKGRTPRPRLLYLAHRVEILEQARDCFRSVLRDPNFGDILGGAYQPTSLDYLFCTITSAQARQLTQTIADDFYFYIVMDEAHHGVAASYAPLYKHFRPHIWLGLTATPERMDGQSILPEFNHRIAAEIRLPEALEERILCPFHYFGITDTVSLADERFWRNGQYSVDALNAVYTGDDARANQRVEALLTALDRYFPSEHSRRAIGFCASIKHANFMADAFSKHGYLAAVLTGESSSEIRSERIRRFRVGEIRYLFTVDVLNEGFDLPDINLVMLLRPTQSLTIFLQQLGRGLRHAPGKDCLTVLDMVGQQHRKYRLDRKFAALLPRQRRRIDEEVEADFPHLPAGCSIHLERITREQILSHIRQTLRDLKNLVIESIIDSKSKLGRVPSFSEFINQHDIDPLILLEKATWSGWKAQALQLPPPLDSNTKTLQKAAQRLVLRDSPSHLAQTEAIICQALNESSGECKTGSKREQNMLFYSLINRPDPALFDRQKMAAWLAQNTALTLDLQEIIAWRKDASDISGERPTLPFDCPLDLHASYGFNEIKAAFDTATADSAGPTGTGVIHVASLKTYLHFVTFIKSERDFSPTTRYHDYPLNRKRLHWESQSNTSQRSQTGQNYLHFKERGYTILFFARINKKEGPVTAPFAYLGPVKELIKADSNRPIRMIWELAHPMPAAMYEQAQLGG
jgi:superfamily II DNA or RNA helicase